MSWGWPPTTQAPPQPLPQLRPSLQAAQQTGQEWVQLAAPGHAAVLVASAQGKGPALHA
jgi:hypothetical protein